MSSKLVKKSLEFVSADDTQQPKKAKRNKKQKQRNKPYSSRKHKSKGKEEYKEQDFTQQNLRYYTNSVWSMKKDMYEKIVKNQEKKKRQDKDAEEPEDKNDFDD